MSAPPPADVQEALQTNAPINPNACHFARVIFSCGHYPDKERICSTHQTKAGNPGRCEFPGVKSKKQGAVPSDELCPWCKIPRAERPPSTSAQGMQKLRSKQKARESGAGASVAAATSTDTATDTEPGALLPMTSEAEPTPTPDLSYDYPDATAEPEFGAHGCPGVTNQPAFGTHYPPAITMPTEEAMDFEAEQEWQLDDILATDDSQDDTQTRSAHDYNNQQPHRTDRSAEDIAPAQPLQQMPIDPRLENA